MLWGCRIRSAVGSERWVWICLDQHEWNAGRECNLVEFNKETNLDEHSPTSLKGDLIQIFIRSLRGKTVCMTIRSYERVRDLKRKIQDQLGIPASLQNLIYAGKSLHKDCKSPESDSIIILNLRFIGGCRGCS